MQYYETSLELKYSRRYSSYSGLHRMTNAFCSFSPFFSGSTLHRLDGLDIGSTDQSVLDRVHLILVF